MSRRELAIYAIIAIVVIGILTSFLYVHTTVSGYFPIFPCADCHS